MQGSEAVVHCVDPNTLATSFTFMTPAYTADRMPDACEANRMGPYFYGAKALVGSTAYPAFNGVYAYNGVLYAGAYTYSTIISPNGGLYASLDGSNWVAIWRDENSRNFHTIAGIYSFGGDNYIVSNCYTMGTVKNFIRLIKVPTIQLRQAVWVEKGWTNLYCPNNIDYTSEGDLLAWFPYTGSEGIWSNETTGGLHGNKCLKWVPSPGQTTASYRRTLQLQASYPSLYPPQNSLVSISVWARGGVGMTKDWQIRFFRYVDSDYFPCYSLYTYLSNDWKQIITTGYMNGTSATFNYNYYICITDENTIGAAQRANAAMYFDGFSICADTDRWRSYSHTFFPTGGTDNGVFKDEFISIPVSHVKTDWTITFDWFPKEGWSNFIADFPIASILGSQGKYMNLVWDVSLKQFNLSDGDANSLNTTITYQWAHYDQLKFALVSDGTNTILYTYDPNNGITGKTMTSVRLSSGAVPINLKLGTKNDESNVGCGLYTNVRIYDSALAAADVNVVFNTVGGK